jgi:hypothetical protein
VIVVSKRTARAHLEGLVAEFESGEAERGDASGGVGAPCPSSPGPVFGSYDVLACGSTSSLAEGADGGPAGVRHLPPAGLPRVEVGGQAWWGSE